MDPLSSYTHQELLDKIGVIVLILDREGRVYAANQVLCELVGYSSDELRGLSWINTFILPEDQNDVSTVFRQIINGELAISRYYENAIRTRMGNIRIIGWHNTLLKDDADRIVGVLSTGEDITARVAAERKIRESERRYRRFVDHVPDALVIHDGKGVILDVNRQACDVLKYTRSELLALNVKDIDRDITEEEMKTIPAQLAREPGVPLIMQRNLYRKDGSRLPAEVKVVLFEEGATPLYIAVVRDIRDRLYQQRRLQDNKDLLRVIIDSIPDIICIKDGRGRWLLANTYNLKLFKLTGVEYRGKTDRELAELTDSLYRPSFLTCEHSDAAAWKHRKPIRQEEYIPTRKGNPRVFDVYKIPLFHGDGRRKAMIVIGHDITDRKKVEEKYRQLFEQSPLAYLASTLDGTIQAVNRSITETFGYAADDLIGHKFTEFLTPASRKKFQVNYPCFLQTGKFSGTDYEVYRADGSVATIQVTATIIRDEAGKPVSVQTIILDVTRQRIIEARVRESEARYRLLFERAPVGIIHYDMDLRVTACNENYVRLMHTPRDVVMNFDIRKLRDKRVIPILEAALRGEEAHWEGEYQMSLREGSVYLSLRTAPLVDGQGNIQGGIAIVVDLSEQKRAETEKSRFMSAIEQASETIVITDTKGIIEYVNPAFEVMTGYKAEEVYGKNPRILKSGHHDAQFYRDLWHTIRKGQVWKGHIVNRKKDGTLFEEDVTISPVRNQDGRITNYVAVKRDVTREVALEKQLNQAMKMEAIGTLAGGIAHDFNNILSAVLGYAEMVALQLDDNDPVREDVAQIITAGHRATDLIRQILTFSRQEEEELRPVKLQFIIKEALKLLRSSLPSSIELHQEIDSSCGSVLADPTSIHQVLINLCTNAKQAMEGSRGKLTVRLVEQGRMDQGGQLPVNVEQDRWVALIVSDTGCGMDAQVKERIFDPFFTTKKKGQGTGLGLSVVHGIVKSHGGEIVVESTPGKGTTFQVFFPLVKSEEPLPEHDSNIEVTGGTERIVLVDDEPLLVDLMERSLSLLGYQVDSFTDSFAALSWIKKHVDNIDLVITDMTMPGITGAELAESVLARNPEMPIILCTGYSEVIDADTALELGIRAFVTKPVDNRQLASTIRNVLDAS